MVISWTLVWAIVIRHIRVLRRDFNALLGTLYWPLLDVLTWGFLGSWIQTTNSAQLPHSQITILLGLLLWQIVGRGCNLIANTFCEELWSNNIINLFSLPLRTIEWMIGIILFSTIMICMTSSVCMSVMFVLYDIPVWYVITTFLIFAPPLFFSMLWIGFMCLQIIVLRGKRGIELAYVIGWMLMPFSGAFYPIEVLPTWGQKISVFLPMRYVFQGMRNYVMYQQNPLYHLMQGYALSVLYAIGAIGLFIYCFNKSKQKGLARLAD